MAVIILLGWPLEWVPIVMIIVPIILPLIEALGFKRLYQTVEHDDTPQIRGMVAKVKHLVDVEEVAD